MFAALHVHAMAVAQICDCVITSLHDCSIAYARADMCTYVTVSVLVCMFAALHMHALTVAHMCDCVSATLHICSTAYARNDTCTNV